MQKVFGIPIKFLKDKPGKKSGEEALKISKEVLDMDFFSQLSYMSAIASSGISRNGLFQFAAKLPFVTARYFKKADFVAKAFNHDYSEACRIVGEATKELEVKAVLLRLSGALASGEEIDKFLEKEAKVFGDSYGNNYEGRLEILRKWTDAYIALIMTSAVVTVMAVVTMIIGSITMPMIIGLSSLTIIVTIAGVWLIYNQAPRETRVHSLKVHSREQELTRNFAKILLPAGAVVVIGLIVMKANLGYAMLVAAGFLFPLGTFALILDSKVNRKDMEIAGFLRSLGGVSQAIRATVSEGMGRLDFRSMGSLRENVELLYTRLLAGINPNDCWQRFVGETGSEQINRSVRIFWDGVTLGGDPERVGNEASFFAMKVAYLRSQRRLIANGLTWLAIIMHAVLVLVVVFINQTLETFSRLVKSIAPTDLNSVQGFSSFGIFASNSMEMNLLQFMVVVIVVVLTFANALAIHATDGGHWYKLAFYLGMTLAISGAIMVFTPPLVDMLLVGMK